MGPTTRLKIGKTGRTYRELLKPLTRRACLIDFEPKRAIRSILSRNSLWRRRRVDQRICHLNATVAGQSSRTGVGSSLRMSSQGIDADVVVPEAENRLCDTFSLLAITVPTLLSIITEALPIGRYFQRS